MYKVMTLIGTRPELIKMSRVIYELDKNVEHVLVHTGQNFDYELNQVFFDDLEIRKPDYFLGVANESTAETIASIISESDKIFKKEKPDALMLYGDTNSCLSVIPAKRRQIPIFHMEAGNRCFDQRVPEELNRKVIDHLSDINLVLSEHARRYLILEGVRPETIIKTGSHMDEVIKYYMPKILSSEILIHQKLEKDKYFIVSSHREENVDYSKNLKDLIESLSELAERYNYPIIFSGHPRTIDRLGKLKTLKKHPLIRFEKPFGFLDYIKLQMNSFCVISDSGTLTEEASLLKIPAINIRNTHERPEGMDEGTLIMSGLKKENVLNSIKVVTSEKKGIKENFQGVSDYNSGPVSKKILRIVLSYTDYINHNVWSK